MASFSSVISVALINNVLLKGAILGVFLPFVSAGSVALFGRFLGFRGTLRITVVLLGLACVVNVCVCYLTVFKGYTFFVSLGSFLTIGLLKVNWLFLFDALSGLMLCTVCLVSFCVHLFSFLYMRDDPHSVRFISYLSFFTFFMLLLVASGNLVLFFWGW